MKEKANGLQFDRKEGKKMNPGNIMQVMQAFGKFQSEHPKFVSFIKYVVGGGIPQGTVIEVTVQKPGEEPVTSNIRVTQSDLELVESLKSMR